MWRSLWRSIDRFSLQYFKYIINELRKINVVDKLNRELVVDILQSIVEIVTYGDRHDSSIFECFMEYQVLAEFVRVLKISKDSKIEAPLLQYLSIMIQNMDSEHAIYYCFSNEYVNSIITHQFDFEGGDLAPYYISFLRAVSYKLNRDTLCLLVKVQEDTVVSFPLYSEALKFAQHGEKMIQTAVRALALNVYNVSDDMVFQYLTTPPVSKYFLDLVLSMREQCIHIDGLVQSTKDMCAHERRKELVLETDKFVDDLYYLKDILNVGDSRLSRLVLQNLFSSLVFPILFPLVQLDENKGPNLSVATSLYIVSRLLQIVDDKDMVDSVASFILYPYAISNLGITGVEKRAEGTSQTENLVSHIYMTEELVCSGPESERAQKMDISCLFEHLHELMSSISQPFSNTWDNIRTERGGIDLYLFSDNHSQLLAALYLFIVLAESKDLDPLLALVIGLSQNINMQKGVMLPNGSLLHIVDGSIFLRHFPQILNGLFKILSCKQSFPVVIQWHTGWFLRKLLVFQERRLTDLDFQSFNTSYEQSRERLRQEFDGCWFDHIPDTFRNEWPRCKAVLEESSQCKDPFFVLELAVRHDIVNGHMASSHVWRKMVDAVKVFILHLQLKAFIQREESSDNPLPNLKSSSMSKTGRAQTSDLSSATFGSEVPLGSGTPCRIAFSKGGIRDIYVIPVSRGISGKLLLVEKLPFHNQRGVVIAAAPLAGLRPTMDENHRTWLHLRIREFDPKFITSESKEYHSNCSSNDLEGRWTLGFSTAEACDAAQSLILEETDKQRSSVESLLSPFLQGHIFQNSLSTDL